MLGLHTTLAVFRDHRLMILLVISILLFVLPQDLPCSFFYFWHSLQLLWPFPCGLGLGLGLETFGLDVDLVVAFGLVNIRANY